MTMITAMTVHDGYEYMNMTMHDLHCQTQNKREYDDGCRHRLTENDDDYRHQLFCYDNNYRHQLATHDD